MNDALLFSILGYLSGNVLYACFLGRVLGKGDVAAGTADGNPGAFNAFRTGGLLCGGLTLLGDVLKGFLPVWLFLRLAEAPGAGLALVLAAPVLGHILPVFHHFRGGKGIAVSFGCLLGLLPEVRPVLILAVSFLLFSLVVKITPHYHRTLAAYLCSAAAMLLWVPDQSVVLGFLLIAGLVVGKLLLSPEQKEKCEVRPAWRS